TAIVGGINWGTASAANHDFDAQISGPAVDNLDNIFVHDEMTCGKNVSAPPRAPDSAIQVVATLPSPQIHPLATTLLDNAQSSIDMQLYVLTDAAVVHSIISAQNRGVQIRLLLDPAQRASDAAALQLRDAGVPVRLYRSHGELLHAKAAVVDGTNV